jgi:hypothetical protein
MTLAAPEGMRILEARYRRSQSAEHAASPVARLYCDGPRVEVESLLEPSDPDSLIRRLLMLVRSCGSDPFAELGARRGDGWTFTAVDTDAASEALRVSATRTAFHSLSVVMPMWNEADNIRPSVEAAHALGRELVADQVIGDYEIVIVDDCSSDATPALAAALARQDDRLRVVRNEQQRKLGGSLRAGFSAARGELVLYTDADLPCDIAEAKKALRLMRLYNAELVSAYRSNRAGEGMLRALYSSGYNGLVRALFGVNVRDVNFAFKLFKRSVLEQACLKSEGSFIDVELLARMERLGLRTVQFAVDYVPRVRGTSSLARPSVIAGILAELVRLYPEIRALAPVPAARVELRPPAPRAQRRGAASG